MRVKLMTEWGDLVGVTDLPPFQVWPSVLLWGERFFKIDTAHDDEMIYLECFAYAITQPVKGDDE